MFKFSSGFLVIEMERLEKFDEYNKQAINGKVFRADEVLFSADELYVPHHWTNERVAEEILQWAFVGDGEDLSEKIFYLSDSYDSGVETRFRVRQLED